MKIIRYVCWESFANMCVQQARDRHRTQLSTHSLSNILYDVLDANEVLPPDNS